MNSRFSRVRNNKKLHPILKPDHRKTIVEVELLEIRDFLAEHPPFDQLAEETLNKLIPEITIRYIRRGREFPPAEGDLSALYVVRQGAISLYDKRKKLISKLSEGDLHSQHCIVTDSKVHQGEAMEDTLLYALPCNVIEKLRKESADFDTFFEQSEGKRLKNALSRISGDTLGTSTMMSTKVSDIIERTPVCIDQDSTIREAAVKMTDERVSSLLVTSDGTLSGILTDKDFRTRCVAAGVDAGRPVSDIMSNSISHIEGSVSAFDALMTMTQAGFHHLPVIENGDLKGMLTVSDLIRQESTSAVYLAGQVRKARNLDELIEASRKLPELQLCLVNAGGTAQHVGNAITAVTDAFTIRLLKLAEDKLGPPPVPYAWVAGGSQARMEQSSHSDQDNGLIISNDMKPEDDHYFEALARYVCDGLNACGYIYCPGNVMAINPEWRQTQKVWEGYFNKWIQTPEPMALMLSSVFFDLRMVHGEDALLSEIRKKMLKQSRENGIFLAFMTGNALKHRPPLGFFRDFVLVHDGEHNNTLDLKHTGIVPIIDLARIYSLAEGIPHIRTIDRLVHAGDTPALSSEGSANLLDAFEFIGTLRIRHQAEQIRRGEKADNFLPPENLSKLEREHLKDAFRVISTMQETLGSRYQAGRLA